MREYIKKLTWLVVVISMVFAIASCGPQRCRPGYHWAVGHQAGTSGNFIAGHCVPNRADR